MRNVPHSMDRFGELEIRVGRDGGSCVIALAGELDLDGVERVTRALTEAEATNATRIVVDLGELLFIDSSGLRLLVEADARSRHDGERLRLTRGTAQVQRAFELSGLGDRMPWSDRID